MSIRTKVLSIVDVMMRVPPILVIDEILKISMGLPNGSSRDFVTDLNTDSLNATATSANMSPIVDTVIDAANTTLEQAIENASIAAANGGLLSSSFGILINDLAQDSYLLELLAITSVKLLLCFLTMLCAIGVFLLWTRHLVMVYLFIASLGLTLLSHWTNVSLLGVIEGGPCLLEQLIAGSFLEALNTVIKITPFLIAQWFMGMLFAYIHLGPRYDLLQKSMPLIFSSPILMVTLPLRPRLIRFLPILANIVPLLLTKITLLCNSMEASRTVYNGYQYAMNFVSNFGLSALIENEWQRLNVPDVLRVFWTIRVTNQFVHILLNEGVTDDDGMVDLLPTFQKLLVDGCETLTAVLGMTSIISVICHYVGKVFQWYLLTFDRDDEKSLGTVSAVLFYILALQTGLTSLHPDKRFVRLCRNLCLLFSALLHFLHNIVSPLLMSLSAVRSPSRKRHFRALSACAFLVITPICMLTFLWSRHSASTWLLAVSAFSIEVIVKVVVSLATYTLFLLDARRQSFWEKLDDYLYYVRAFGNSVEFCFGILLFLNGAWILFFESENAIGGALRAIMMCIHAYFNIWCEALAGWSVFIKRRSAVHKISSLPEATTDQLQAFDDVCAICYQEMYSAKITRCHHYFHGVCLRKWLYVQDRCPLCHEIMMYPDRRDDSDASRQQVEQQPAPAIQDRPQENNDTETTNRNVAQSDSTTTTSNSSDNNEDVISTTANSADDNLHQTSDTSSSISSRAAAMATATAATSNTTHGFGFPSNLHVQD